jgi:HEPN domain-containing protein
LQGEVAPQGPEWVLVNRKAPVPRTHDLDLHLKLCQRHDPSFAEIAEPCEALNEFGSPVRYPAAGFPVPDEPEARESLALAERIAAFVRARLQGH